MTYFTRFDGGGDFFQAKCRILLAKQIFPRYVGYYFWPSFWWPLDKNCNRCRVHKVVLRTDLQLYLLGAIVIKSSVYYGGSHVTTP